MFILNHFRLLTICFMLLAQHLFSQIVLDGVITDNGAEYLGNGAEPVVNALVTLTDQTDAQRTFSAYTNDQGQYSIQITTTAVDDPDANKPGNFTLHQNYPNPFNPSTVIEYELNKPSHITIEIYNVLGQKIRTLFDGYQAAGPGRVIWDATNDWGQGVSAGVYIYSLRRGSVHINKKMVLIDGQQGTINSTMSSSRDANIAGLNVLRKPLSDQYTLTVTGPDIASWEQQNLEITGNTTLDISVARTVTDIDGNVYGTVKIGAQRWMAENLKVSRYRNGRIIPEVTNDANWVLLFYGARCKYDNDENNVDTYGYLYNFYVIEDSGNISPEGWHVPTDDDWKELEMYLGMSQSEADTVGYRGTDEGSKLAGRADLWPDGILKINAAFGASGFFGLPGGSRQNSVNYPGTFFQLGNIAYFWTASWSGDLYAWYRILNNGRSDVLRDNIGKRFGYSIRCVRDD